MSDQNPVHVLHPEESWGFLRTHEFGRLAFHLVGEVHITPINYDVAFEVDEVSGERATSVIVRGRARTLEGQAAYIVERLPVRPWVDTPKSIVVAIEVDEISGRRFDLTRPWLRDLPTG
jgi:nitroimidazol reductase NimA-like FMN-containing flavoprotein (pyridoxamine 5'-phosphate oxidase superfamily)